MDTNIVGVKYEDDIYKKTFKGREYTYFTAIPLQVGDIVKAPTVYGISNALVTTINVPEERIESFKNEVKTITIKMNKEMFLKEVKENKVIVMDNATFHRKNKLYDLCKNANKNLRLIFLPPYSPELNPIEKYWALLKRKIKKIDKNDKCFKDSIYKLF